MKIVHPSFLIIFKSIIFAIVFTLCTGCSKTDHPAEAPALSVNPSTALVFSAEATESFVIAVTTNQASWNAVSNQAWCKIQKEAGSFTVTAIPNTSANPSPAASITISAGGATPVIVTANQKGKENSYPETTAELETAITNNWIFPESSDYLSLEFGEKRSYTLLARKPFVKSDAQNIYLLSGNYTIDANLHTLLLGEFGSVYITDLSTNTASVKIKPANQPEVSATLTEQKFDTPVAQPHKYLKTMELNDDDGTYKYTFTYGTDKKLQQIAVAIGKEVLEINITYDGTSSVKVNYPAEALGKLPVYTTFKLNSAGLAVSGTIQEGSTTDIVYFTYNNKRELVSMYSYTNTLMQWYRTATWKDGDIHSAYFQDYQTSKSWNEFYQYSTYMNKAKTFYPFAYGSYYYEYLLGPLYCGILGEINNHLPAEAQDEGAQFNYKSFDDGYPVLIEVFYPNYPADNYTITMTYE